MNDEITLVITVLDEAEGVQALLDSIARQTLKPDELIICDAGSGDDTLKIIEEWQDSPAFSVKVIERQGFNISAGRNAAISASKASIVCVTDGGCVLDEKWLENIVRPVREGDAETGVVYGRTKAVGESVIGKQFAILHHLITGKKNKTETERSSRSVAFRRAYWEKVGGYPEWLTLAGEDTLFFLELAKVAKSESADNALVYWRHGAESLRKIYKMHLRNSIGSGEANMWPLRYMMLIGVYAAASAGLLASLWRHFMVFIALMIVLVASFRQLPALLKSRRKSLLTFFLIPIIVLVRDLGMIAGYLIGFKNRVMKRMSFLVH